MFPERRKISNVKDAKKMIKELMIDNILHYLKTGIFPNTLNPNSFMDAWTIVNIMSDEGNKNCHELLTYHNQVIKDYIIECEKELNCENNQNLIDKFLLHTEHIKFLIYWMNRIFSYLDAHYTKKKCENTLGQYSMNLYKSDFFDVFKNNIFIEVDNLINEERNGFGTDESKAKIKSITKLFEEMEYPKPGIVKEQGKLIWINKSDNGNLPESELKKLWVNEYFIKDTEKFIKNKAITDFQRMTIPDYLSSQAKYLEEEKERLKEYIDPKYHDKINAINYQYLLDQYKEEFEITDVMVMKALEKQEKTNSLICIKYLNYFQII